MARKKTNSFKIKNIDDCSIDSIFYNKVNQEDNTFSELLRVLKFGAFGLFFSEIEQMHKQMIGLEKAGFVLKDVLMIGQKTDFKPVILVQKKIEKGLTVAENIIKHQVGVLNLEATRIPYSEDEKDKKIGHNPHPKGRVPANLVRTQKLDEKDRYFLIEDFQQFDAELLHLVKLISFENQTILAPFLNPNLEKICSILNRNLVIYNQ